ncbi:MAG: thiol reductase thioredoxin, partial [Candidatus Sabulitectum sp.]|nr:thiol reductase thioredoxin [Candidatus Sabulitectum sp.]
DFWAPWCGPCKMMAPAFVQAAGQLEPHVRLAKVDTESQQNLGVQFGIRSIPTMIIFVGSIEKSRQSGAMDSTAIISWVRSQLT